MNRRVKRVAEKRDIIFHKLAAFVIYLPNLKKYK
ncbi:Uncharacterised protein [Niallia circulans]|nr:Uncharacterised protein [Niallia circulans]